MQEVLWTWSSKTNWINNWLEIWKNNEITATGRRKSIAQVKMVPGTGITVNGQDVDKYIPFKTLVMDLKQPLVLTKNEKHLILI